MLLEQRLDGAHDLTLTLLDQAGRPLSIADLELEFALPSAEVSGLRRQPQPDGPGRYRLEGLRLPVEGLWELRADLLVDAFTKLILRSDLPIGVAEPAERRFEGRGEVVLVRADRNLVVIAHGDIPGYMSAMTMGFTATDPTLLQDLESGAQVRFFLDGEGRLVAIERR